MARVVLRRLRTMPKRRYCLIVVRRGEAEVFERLQAEFAGTPDVAEVIWDRRVRDRRVIIQDVEVERRRGERRAPLDATVWGARGYLLARPEGRQTRGASRDAGDAPVRQRGRRRSPRRRRTGESGP